MRNSPLDCWTARVMLTNGNLLYPYRSRIHPSNDHSRPPRLMIKTDLRFVPTPTVPSLRSCPPLGPRHSPCQTGRHRPPSIPYVKPPNARTENLRRGRSAPEPPGSLASRIATSRLPINPKSRRDPVGTPVRLPRLEGMEAQKAAHSKLNAKLRSEDMKMWLRSRVLQEGVMDMSVSMRASMEGIALPAPGTAGRSLAQGAGDSCTGPPECTS